MVGNRYLSKNNIIFSGYVALCYGELFQHQIIQVPEHRVGMDDANSTYIIFKNLVSVFCHLILLRLKQCFGSGK